MLRWAMKIITVYDGTIQSKTALQYGLQKVRERGGEIILLQIFQRSLFIDYGAGPKAEEFARAEESRHLRDAERIILEYGQGAQVRILSEDGEPEETILRIAETEQADLILASPRYRGISLKAICPVYIMPGTVLVPVDSSYLRLLDINSIIAEAKATGSKILLLGIIPVHLYSGGEKKELIEVKKAVLASIKKIKTSLSGQGVDVAEIIRSGYPDEEIIQAAKDQSASLILLPAGGKTPSELTKAAAILLDEPERVPMPILLLQTAEA
jgi:nucleotide-binding universal stress UspA family protein